MSEEFKVEIVDDPQNVVVEIKYPITPDIEVHVAETPTNLIVEVDNGIKGDPGPSGPPGEGVPVGGATGEVLRKASAGNYDTEWHTLTKSDVGLSNVDNTADLDKPISSATQTALDAKEDESNKSSDVNLGTSNTLYPTQGAVKTYVDTAVAGATIPDATTLVKGKVRLSGDLSGTADSPTVPGLANKEDVANKSTDTGLGSSDTLYPSQNAVKVYVDTAVAGATIPDATTLVKGKIKLAGDLSGTADLPTVPGLANKFDIPTGLVTDYLDGTGTPVPFPDVVDQSEFDEYNLLQKEPTGFPNRTDSVMSFDPGTRIFTIAPAVTSFDVFIKGFKFTKTASQSVTIPNLDGSHYIYFDIDGILQTTQAIGPEIFQDNAFVSIIYWNSSTGEAVYRAEERHGLVMDGATHGYLHTVFGARYLSGFALQGFSVDGTGNLATDAQFASDSGSFRDEDLLIQALAQAQIPILYKIGNLWRKKPADSFPVIYSGTAGYTGPNGRLPYNLLSGGVWSLSEVPNNQFVLVHFFATNDVTNPVVGIQGIATYNSISGARTGATAEIGSLTGIPFAEFLAIGSVIFETANTYANTPKARVRSTDTGGNYVDFRGTQAYTPAYGSASSHSLLSNLSNDDHLQYLTTARGDARYYTETETDTLLAGKQNTITGGASTVTTANLTSSRALASNGSGKIAVSNTTATELGFLSGVTSAIQTQLNFKQPIITGGATTITVSDLSPNRALISNSLGKVVVSDIDSTQLEALYDIQGNIQDQLDNKQDAIVGAASTVTQSDLNPNAVVVSNAFGKIVDSSVSTTELGYLSGVTSSIQTQIDSKQDQLVIANDSVVITDGAGNLTAGLSVTALNTLGGINEGTTVQAQLDSLRISASPLNTLTFAGLPIWNTDPEGFNSSIWTLYAEKTNNPVMSLNIEENLGLKWLVSNYSFFTTVGPFDTLAEYEEAMFGQICDFGSYLQVTPFHEVDKSLEGIVTGGYAFNSAITGLGKVPYNPLNERTWRRKTRSSRQSVPNQANYGNHRAFLMDAWEQVWGYTPPFGEPMLEKEYSCYMRKKRLKKTNGFPYQNTQRILWWSSWGRGCAVNPADSTVDFLPLNYPTIIGAVGAIAKISVPLSFGTWEWVGLSRAGINKFKDIRSMTDCTLTMFPVTTNGWQSILYWSNTLDRMLFTQGRGFESFAYADFALDAVVIYPGKVRRKSLEPFSFYGIDPSGRFQVDLSKVQVKPILGTVVRFRLMNKTTKKASPFLPVQLRVKKIGPITGIVEEPCPVR
jgi:hypothetical protein